MLVDVQGVRYQNGPQMPEEKSLPLQTEAAEAQRTIQETPIEGSRHNYGVYFRKRPLVVLHDYSLYDVMFVVPVLKNPLSRNITLDLRCRVAGACDSILNGELTIHMRGVMESIFAHDDLIDVLLHKPFRWRKPNRRNRGLFNFIGSLSHTLFGTATSDQVDKLVSRIQKVEQTMNSEGMDTKKFMDMVVHFTNTTNSQIHSVNDMIINNRKRLTSLSNTLIDWQEMLNQTYRVMGDRMTE